MISTVTLALCTEKYADKSRRGIGVYLRLICIFVLLAPILVWGCSTTEERAKARSLSQEAHDFFNQGNYQASLRKYEQVIKKDPTVADRVLFEMGVIYAHPRNELKDYQSAQACFQRIISEYPDSVYRQESQLMIFQINNVISKDKIIAAQHTQIEASRKENNYKDKEISELQDKVAALEQKIFILGADPADKVLIEKKERRLTLLSNGEVIKTYKIALGGNPVGPKDRQGDNKTPEGLYIIESRNRNSGYYLSLRISYPNSEDKKRAKKLGVDPGGDIMIHGIKNGLSWVGSIHSKFDWTEGCIAVTDEEMDEIDRLVPNGTLVEIRP